MNQSSLLWYRTLLNMKKWMIFWYQQYNDKQKLNPQAFTDKELREMKDYSGN
jgi:hypothetical protein